MVTITDDTGKQLGVLPDEYLAPIKLISDVDHHPVEGLSVTLDDYYRMQATCSGRIGGDVVNTVIHVSDALCEDKKILAVVAVDGLVKKHSAGRLEGESA